MIKTNVEEQVLKALLSRAYVYTDMVLAASDKAVKTGDQSAHYLLRGDTLDRLNMALMALNQWGAASVDRDAVQVAVKELHTLAKESFDPKYLLGRMYLGLYNDIAIVLDEYLNEGPDSLLLRDALHPPTLKSFMTDGYSLGKLQRDFSYHLANGDGRKARDLAALSLADILNNIGSMTLADKASSPLGTQAINLIQEECKLLLLTEQYANALPLETVNMMAWPELAGYEINPVLSPLHPAVWNATPVTTSPDSDAASLAFSTLSDVDEAANHGFIKPMTDELDVWVKRLHEHDTLPSAIAQTLLDDGRCNESPMLYELREFATIIEPEWDNTIEDMDCSTQANYTARNIGQNLQPMPEQIKADVGLINSYIEGLNLGIEQATDDLNSYFYDGEDIDEGAQAQVLKARELKAAATTFSNELVKRLEAIRQSKLTADEKQAERSACPDDVDYVRQGHDFAIKERDKQFTREGMVRVNSLPKIAGLGFEQDEQVVNTALLSDGSLIVITDRLMNLHSPESSESIIALGKLDLDDIVATAVMPGDDEYDLAEFLTIIEHKFDDDELMVINADGTENKAAFNKMVEAMSQAQTYGMRP